jgi:hypothetical protein
MRPTMKIANPNNVPFITHMMAYYFENHTSSRREKGGLNRLPHHGIFSKLIKMLFLKSG